MDMFVKRKRALLIILSAMLVFSSACGAGGSTAKENTETPDASANTDAGNDTAVSADGKTAGTEKTAFSPEGVSASAASGIGSHATVLSGKYKGMTADQITASLTLEQKADQMVQPAVYK